MSKYRNLFIDETELQYSRDNNGDTGNKNNYSNLDSNPGAHTRQKRLIRTDLQQERRNVRTKRSIEAILAATRILGESALFSGYPGLITMDKMDDKLQYHEVAFSLGLLAIAGYNSVELFKDYRSVREELSDFTKNCITYLSKHNSNELFALLNNSAKENGLPELKTDHSHVIVSEAGAENFVNDNLNLMDKAYGIATATALGGILAVSTGVGAIIAAEETAKLALGGTAAAAAIATSVVGKEFASREFHKLKNILNIFNKTLEANLTPEEINHASILIDDAIESQHQQAILDSCKAASASRQTKNEVDPLYRSESRDTYDERSGDTVNPNVEGISYSGVSSRSVTPTGALKNEGDRNDKPGNQPKSPTIFSKVNEGRY